MVKEKEQKKQENKEYLMQQQQTLKSMSFICSFFFGHQNISKQIMCAFAYI